MRGKEIEGRREREGVGKEQQQQKNF